MGARVLIRCSECFSSFFIVARVFWADARVLLRCSGCLSTLYGC